jgi:hypothetical protein
MWSFSGKKSNSADSKSKSVSNDNDSFLCLSEMEDLISRLLAKNMCNKLSRFKGFKKRQTERFLAEVFGKLVKKH